MRVGFLTIGESPRKDVTDDLRRFLPEDLEIVEAGALDGLSKDYIREKLRPDPGDVLYVSRLRSGMEVELSKKKLVGLMQNKINWLNSLGVELIVILCTGEFPKFESKVPIVYPERILKGIASSVSVRGRVGVMIPRQEQVDYAENKWREFFEDVKVYPISPYTSSLQDFTVVANKMLSENVDLVIMDCIGYTSQQRDSVLKVLKRPVIASRTVLARTLNELLTL
ncbi:MAG: AroM family protein [Zestosphaera sp.]